MAWFILSNGIVYYSKRYNLSNCNNFHVVEYLWYKLLLCMVHEVSFLCVQCMRFPSCECECRVHEASILCVLCMRLLFIQCMRLLSCVYSAWGFSPVCTVHEVSLLCVGRMRFLSCVYCMRILSCVWGAWGFSPVCTVNIQGLAILRFLQTHLMLKYISYQHSQGFLIKKRHHHRNNTYIRKTSI